MKLFNYFYIFLISFSLVLTEEIEITAISSSFTIDTIEPVIDLFSPSHGDIYGPTDEISLSWYAFDDSPAPLPMTLYVSANLDNPYHELLSGFPNGGSLQLDVPNYINTLFGSIKLEIADYYGNISYVYSSGYFTIGNPNENIYNVIDEEITLQTTSSPFTIDTKPPIVSWIYPNESRYFQQNQAQVVRWYAQDENLPNNPIDISFIDGGVDSYTLLENITNNGQRLVYMPEIQTSLGHFKVTAVDIYGNSSYDLSDEYMNIGQEGEDDFTNLNVEIEVQTEPFIVDTKLPTFNLINEQDYFYPNGGELLTDYNNINLNWDASDDSFSEGKVEVSLAYLLGGWFTPIGVFNANELHSAIADFSINGLVDNTIWARLIYTAIDDYGNMTNQYSDDYFTLGSSDGSISADLFDEDQIEMFISWTWENQKHRIKFTPRALEFLDPGDQITIVGENSIQNTDCASPTGILDLGVTEVEPSGINDINTATHVVINQGINHCASGGGALTGYTQGDSIRIKINKPDTSFFLRPSNYAGSLVFNNSVTIVKEFNLNPYEVDRSNTSLDLLSIDERDWDSFNVYGKVTNHQGSTRSCDNDGVCDHSELLESFLNEGDCLANDGLWSGSLCFFDYNGDGSYSPNEVNENIADCFSDCCSQEGLGENIDWCFIENVNSEEYTHSLVSNNYLPNDATSATVNYRVWLTDDQSNEIYKTVDTEDYEIQIGTDDIPDYINNLNAGWNWISLNVENDNMFLNSIFSNSTLTNADYIKSQTSSSSYYAAGDGQWYPDWVTDLKNAYLIKIEQDASILYSGTTPNPSNVTINILEGWNWIGYTPSSAIDINTALAGLTPSNNDYIKGQTVNSTYYASGEMWYPSITLEPTKGYMFKSFGSQSLNYPNIESTSNNLSISRASYNDSDFNYRNFELNASATLAVNMKHLNIGVNDKISVFSGKELRGFAYGDICPLTNELVFNLMMYSNEEHEDDLSITYYNYDNKHEYNVRETIDFINNDILGDVFNPIVLTDLSMPLKYELSAPYPNPFNPTTTIELSLLDSQSNFALNIYDIRGRLIETLHSGSLEYGYHKFRWNANQYSSGIYFVNMVTNSGSFTKKITLLK